MHSVAGVCGYLAAGFVIYFLMDWWGNGTVSQEVKRESLSENTSGLSGEAILESQSVELTGRQGHSSVTIHRTSGQERLADQLLGEVEWGSVPPYEARYQSPGGSEVQSPAGEIGTIGALSPSEIYGGVSYTQGGNGTAEIDPPGIYTNVTAREVYPEVLFSEGNLPHLGSADPASEQSVDTPPYRGMEQPSPDFNREVIDEAAWTNSDLGS